MSFIEELVGDLPEGRVVIEPEALPEEILAAINRWARSVLGRDLELWDVLSALRGPDCGIGPIPEDGLKMATTAVLRGLITPAFDFVLVASDPSILRLRAGLDMAAGLHNTKDPGGYPNHFVGHIRSAVHAVERMIAGRTDRDAAKNPDPTQG